MWRNYILEMEIVILIVTFESKCKINTRRFAYAACKSMKFLVFFYQPAWLANYLFTYFLFICYLFWRGLQ